MSDYNSNLIYSNAENCEIIINYNGTIVWINNENGCISRISNIKNLVIEDNRTSEHINKLSPHTIDLIDKNILIGSDDLRKLIISLHDEIEPAISSKVMTHEQARSYHSALKAIDEFFHTGVYNDDR